MPATGRGERVVTAPHKPQSIIDNFRHIYIYIYIYKRYVYTYHRLISIWGFVCVCVLYYNRLCNGALWGGGREGYLHHTGLPIKSQGCTVPAFLPRLRCSLSFSVPAYVFTLNNC